MLSPGVLTIFGRTCRTPRPRAHDDVIKWKHFPRYWPFVWGLNRSRVNSPHKGQWRGALMFSLICSQINCWVNNGEAGDLRRHRAHYDVTVMQQPEVCLQCSELTASKSADQLHVHARSRDEMIILDHSDQQFVSSRAAIRPPDLHASAGVADQCLPR